MKHCPKCNVDVNSTRKKCPLCYTILEDDKQELSYQPHPKKVVKEHLSLVTKILLLLSFVAMVVSIIVNINTLDKNAPIYWFILVLVGVPYFWLSVRYVILGKNKSIPTKIFSEAISTIIIVVLVEIVICVVSRVDKDNLWSVNYVMPGILLLTSLGLFVTSTVIKELYCDSILYLLFLSLFELAYFIVYMLTDLITVPWMAYTCGAASVLIIVAMFIFHFKDTKEEFIKRFHI